MKLTVLDGFEAQCSVTQAVQEALQETDIDYSYFTLREMELLPCIACGSCGLRTPGECVLKDDLPQLMRELARSTVMMLLTPVRFGGYSSQLKLAMDRFMLLGLPLYMVKNGQLLHPARYDIRALLAVGLLEDNLDGQKENFRQLAAANARNLHLDHRVVLLDSAEKIASIRQAVAKSLKEVFNNG